MSEPTPPGQSDFIRTLLQLNAAQASAKVGTPEREDADHELTDLGIYRANRHGDK